MLYAFTKLAAFVGIGLLWRVVKPWQLSAGALQRPLMALLYSVFLPALALTVFWKMPLNANTLRVAVVVAGSTGLALAAAWFLLRHKPLSPGVKGAMILAAAFSNVVFIGMPVTQTFIATWTSRAAMQFEMFAVFPLIFTAGVMVASSAGGRGGREAPWLDLLKEPMVWAAIIGLLLNGMNARMPPWLNSWLSMLVVGIGIAPLLLITVGLSLKWQPQWSQLVPVLVIVAGIQLLLLPFLVWALANVIGLAGPQTLRALMLQAAMPSAILGFVICDRYGLDSSAYAAAFTATTALAVVSASFLHMAMRSGMIS